MFLAKEAGNVAAARHAASLIVEKAGTISSSQLIQAAKQVLENADPVGAPAGDFVREARKLLAIDFRNPILLMDVARELTARRHEDRARRYVRAAVALAPQSRFVVRAAARYYLHIGEHELAHDLLRRSPLLQSDPWVQASEIAVATVRGRTSTLAKQTIRALSQEQRIRAQATELASAVATVELLSGSQKKAKQLFQKALEHPNDNSLAQVEWAANRLKLVVDETALRTPLAFEANSNHAYRRLQLDDAIVYAKQWSDDEPFASRPFDALCYLYSLEGRFDEARKAAEAGLAVDGSSFSTRLNLFFTRIQCGAIDDDAFPELERLSRDPEAKAHAAHLLANAGALAFATGEAALGRDFYQRAIRAARASNEPHTEALARAFFARAATMAGDDQAPAIVDEAAKAVDRLPNPGAIHVVRTLVDATTRKQLEATASARVATRKWKWDAASNTLRLFD
jgi:tetratricopeptide (TPR) repeat protein